jgi:hypothetical protein
VAGCAPEEDVVGPHAGTHDAALFEQLREGRGRLLSVDPALRRNLWISDPSSVTIR